MPKKTASLHPVGVPNRAFAQWGMHGPSRSIVRCSCLLSNGADRISNQMARGILHT